MTEDRLGALEASVRQLRGRLAITSALAALATLVAIATGVIAATRGQPVAGPAPAAPTEIRLARGDRTLVIGASSIELSAPEGTAKLQAGKLEVTNKSGALTFEKGLDIYANEGHGGPGQEALRVRSPMGQLDAKFFQGQPELELTTTDEKKRIQLRPENLVVSSTEGQPKTVIVGVASDGPFVGLYDYANGKAERFFAIEKQARKK